MIGGLGESASFWLFRISISLEATWSTVAPKTSQTIGLSVNLITFLTLAIYLIASLPALKCIYTPFIATGLRNCATFEMNCTILQSTSPKPSPYWYLNVPMNT